MGVGPMAGKIDFEFGESEAAAAFFVRNPKFWPTFERLLQLTNKCFGRSWNPSNRMEDVGFHLGEACRSDFLEVVFVAVHGHAAAAQKLLRGLYERAATLEYIRRNPDKAERFVRFAAIQEFKAAKKALEAVTTEEFDAVMGPGRSFQETKALYEQVKPEFQVTACRKCGTKETAFAWDVDMASMVHTLGSPYKELFLVCYTVPTLEIHATLASAFSRDEASETRTQRRIHDGDLALKCAMLVFVEVLQSQNEIFLLNLSEDVEVCGKEVGGFCNGTPTGHTSSQTRLT